MRVLHEFVKPGRYTAPRGLKSVAKSSGRGGIKNSTLGVGDEHESRLPPGIGEWKPGKAEGGVSTFEADEPIIVVGFVKLEEGMNGPGYLLDGKEVKSGKEKRKGVGSQHCGDKTSEIKEFNEVIGKRQTKTISEMVSKKAEVFLCRAARELILKGKMKPILGGDPIGSNELLHMTSCRRTLFVLPIQELIDKRGMETVGSLHHSGYIDT